MATSNIRNLKQFEAWIENVTKKLVPEKVALFQKRVVLELFRRVVFKSPVGNPALWKNPSSAPPGYVGGKFRANWQVTVGAPSQSIIESTKVPTFGLITTKVPLGTTVWLVNNVPYAERLEFGWSSQAPGGVVAISIAEVIGTVR